MARTMLVERHMRTALCLAAIIASSSGCYLGRTPTAKHASYAVNGGAIALGLILAASSSGGDSCMTDDASCVGGAVGSGGGAAVGAILAAAGLVGLGITLAVPTQQPEGL